jgi:hypothetical protein
MESKTINLKIYRFFIIDKNFYSLFIRIHELTNSNLKLFLNKFARIILLLR